MKRLKLRISEVKFENVREFDELSLDLGDVESNNLSLIQMPNGTGKTTTLNLLRKLICGKELTKDEVSSYEPGNFNAEEGKFEVEFIFNDNPFTLGLSMDYFSKEFHYYNSKPRREMGGMERGHWLPIELKYLMDEHFSNLFIFNGEYAEDLLDRSKMRAENAIKSMYFLNTIEEQKGLIEDEIGKIYESKANSAKTPQGLSGLRTRRENAQKCFKGLKNKEEKLSSKLKEVKKEINNKEKERKNLIENTEDLVDDYKELTLEINKLQNEIKASTTAMLEKIRRPGYFSKKIRKDLENLLESMDFLELPKSTSIEFFSELANRENCICGRKINEEESKNIKQNAKKYLSEEDISILNALKHHIRDMPDYQELSGISKDLEDKKLELKKKKQEREELENNLDPKSKKKAEDLQEKVNVLKEKRKKLENKINKITSNDRSFRESKNLRWRDNAPLCKKKISTLNDKIESAIDVVNLNKKGQKLKKIMEEITENGLETIKKKIIRKTNDRIEQILGSSDIRISKIDRSIYIEGRENVSTGQRLSVAYSFISTLFNESNLDFPFIVDNPATSIDLDVRPEVAKMIPNLFEQIAIFMISPERENFVDYLDSERDIGYYTVYKSKNGSQRINLDSKKESFMEFQSEVE